MLRRDEFSITGLTSNPTIFDHAIKNSGDYDDAIKSKLAEGKLGEKLFFELALDHLAQAADLFRPVHDRTCGVDAWVSGYNLAGSKEGNRCLLETMRAWSPSRQLLLRPRCSILGAKFFSYARNGKGYR